MTSRYYSKSPVVYWTSEWVKTGKQERYMDKEGNTKVRVERILVGKVNKGWTPNTKR